MEFLVGSYGGSQGGDKNGCSRGEKVIEPNIPIQYFYVAALTTWQGGEAIS